MGQLFTLTPEELAGDLPPVCVRTGETTTEVQHVRFTRAPWWSGLPLLGLAVWTVSAGSFAPLASFWVIVALLLPVLTSRGTSGRLPLSLPLRGRLAALRRRRMVFVLGALLLTWVSVSLLLIGSRAAGLLVLAAVLALYLSAVGSYLVSRSLGVRGWPERDGGATVRHAHPAFVDAVELRRTGHRP